jgi:hypothetical protein
MKGWDSSYWPPFCWTTHLKCSSIGIGIPRECAAGATSNLNGQNGWQPNEEEKSGVGIGRKNCRFSVLFNFNPNLYPLLMLPSV